MSVLGRSALLGAVLTIVLVPGVGAQSDVPVPPTARDDAGFLVPSHREVINVVANDVSSDGTSLVVTGHGDPQHGTVDCDATTCTYTPPVRTVPDDESDEVLTPEQPDSFSYTVASSQSPDVSSTATVTLTPVPTKTTAHKGRVGPKRYCPKTGSRKCRKKTPQKQPSDPGTGPGADGPAITLAEMLPRPMAAAAYTDSQLYRYTTYRCTWTGGPWDVGFFDIKSQIGEIANSGVSRLAMTMRKQVYGQNFYGTGSYVTLEAAKWAVNFPSNGYNNYLPSGRFHTWRYGWGSPGFVDTHGPFRMQIRLQWLKHHTYLPDETVKNTGFVTLCEGSPRQTTDQNY